MTIQHLRSSTANKRPTAAAMSDGQLAVNTNATNPGLFFKDADGNIRKTGPVFIGTSAPNSSPASGGSTGHAVGEQWLDSTGGVYVHKIWDGTAWRSESGSFVSVAGDNMTGNLTLGTDKVVLNATSGSATFASSVGIGTTSPSSRLHVKGAADSYLTLQAGTTDGNDGVLFQNSSGTQKGALLYDTDDNYLLFNVNSGERLRIDSSGNIGINRTDPDQRLNVNGNIEVNAYDGTSGSGGYYTSKGLIIGNAYDAGKSAGDDRNGIIWQERGLDLVFATTDTERLRIDSSGNVGIGTTSPTSLLELSGVSNPQITLDGTTNAGQRGLIFAYSGTQFGSVGQNIQTGELRIRSGESGQTGYFINFGVNGNDAARIDGSGRVGIGNTTMSSFTANASDNLVVGSGSGSEGITVYSAAQGSLTFADGTSGTAAYRGAIEYSHTGDHLAFRTAGVSNRIVIDSSGDVAIGNSNPVTSGGFRTLTIGDGSTTGGQLHLENSSGGNFNLWHATTGVNYYAATAVPQIFHTNGSERMRLDSSGRLLTGTGTARANFFNTTNSAKLQVESTTSSTSAISVTSNANSAVEQPVLILAKSRGTSAGSNTLVSIGDAVGTLSFQGNDGTDFVEAARIETAIDGNTTANQMPGRITFNTTPSGASSPTEKMRIRNNGYVGIGVTVPDEKLHVAHAGAASVLIEGASSESSNVFFGDGASNTSGAIRYLHSTDAMRFDVFGSEQMRLDKFARLSIGTTVANSGRIVHAHNSSTNSNAYFHSTNGSTGTTNLDGCLMGMGNATNAYFWNYENGFIQFATNSTARMTIDSSGRVGIGTASPGVPLDIASNNSTANLRITDNTNGARIKLVAASTQFDLYNTGGAGYIGTPTNSDILIATNNSEVARFDSSGRLLVGTSSDTGNSKLTVRGGTGVNQGILDIQANIDSYSIGSGNPAGYLRFKARDSGSSNYQLAHIGCLLDGASSSASDVPGALFFATTADGASSPTEALRITSDGNLGIGETDPSSNLVVKQSGSTFTTQSQTVALFQRSSTTGHGAKIAIVSGNASASDINFGDTDSEDVGLIQYAHTDNSFRFRTNANERLRIDSSGRLLVNKTATSTNDGTVQISSSAGTPKLVLENSSTNAAHLLCQNSNTGYGTNDGLFVGLLGTTGYMWNYESGLIFGASNAEAARIDSNRRMYIGHTNSNLAAPLSIALYGMANINDNAGAVTSGLLRLTDFGTTDNEFIGLEIRNKNSGDVRIMNVDSATTNTADMAFLTDGGTLQERMRIDSSGNLLLRGHASTWLNNYGGAIYNKGTSASLVIGRTDATGVAFEAAAVFTNSANNAVGSISISNTTTNYNTSSDHRLKENIVDITDGIARFKQLQPRRFNFIGTASTTVDGFLAHEAQTVVPEAVTGTHNEVDDDGNAVMQGIDQSKLVPLLTAALQEAIAKIETLEAKVAALEAG